MGHNGDRFGEQPRPEAHTQTLDTESLNNIAWPEGYGAEGDGSTDDQAAIQDALDNEDYIVFRPNKTYYIGGPVVVKTSDTNVYIPESTTIQTNSDDITPNRVFEIGDANNAPTNVTVEGGGVIDGQSSAPGGSQIVEDEGGAFNIFSGEEITVRGLSIVDAREYAFEVSQSKNVLVDDIQVDGCGNDAFSCSDGGHTAYGSVGDSVTNGVTFENCTVNATNDAAFEVDDGPTNVTFLDGWAAQGGCRVHSHTNEVNPQNVTYNNITLTDSNFKISGLGGTGEAKGYRFIDCTGGIGATIQFYLDPRNDLKDVEIRCGTAFASASWGLYIISRNSGDTLKDVRVIGGEYKSAQQNGIVVEARDGDVRNITISNVTAKNNGLDDGASDQDRAGINLIEGSGTLTDVTISNVDAYDDQSTKTQQFGVYQNGDYNLYDGNNLRGNAQGAFGGTLGTNSVKGDNIT